MQRTFAWLHQCKRLAIRWEYRAEIHEGLVKPALLPGALIPISGIRRVHLLVPNELPGTLDVTAHNVIACIH